MMAISFMCRKCWKHFKLNEAMLDYSDKKYKRLCPACLSAVKEKDKNDME